MELKEYILNNPELKALAEVGNDAGIVEKLNKVSEEILIDREYLEPNFIVSLSASAYSAAFQKQNAELIAFWQTIVIASTGFTSPVKSTDPNLLQQLGAAKQQGLITDEQINYYAKRPGTVSEREWNRLVTLDEVSNLFLNDRSPVKG